MIVKHFCDNYFQQRKYITLTDKEAAMWEKITDFVARVRERKAMNHYVHLRTTRRVRKELAEYNRWLHEMKLREAQ